MTRLLRIKMAVAGVLGNVCQVCHCTGYWLHEDKAPNPGALTRAERQVRESIRERYALQVGHPNGRRWSIRRLNTEDRWARYLREAVSGRVQAECGPCNRKHGGSLRYKKVDRTRQGAKRRRELEIGRAVERAAAENSHEFWKNHG